jgi:NAD(P)-dependent dehydrogenase (short-subunit alcohol dehydrogenase family)
MSSVQGPDRFGGKTALITGGAAGIGAAVARGFFEAGANVVVADIHGAAQAAREIDPTGSRTLAVTADVTSDQQVEEAVRQAVARFGSVDILVNNAGIATGIPPRPFQEIAVDEWLRVYDVNVVGIFRCCRAVLAPMKAAGGGRIVNIGSAAAFKGVPLLLHYVSSKGAVLALTRSLAKELGEHNILVNCVAPGFTISPAVLGNEGQMSRTRANSLQGRAIARDQFPQDLVGAVLFLCSGESAFMTGQTLVVDGGTYLH